MPVFDAPYRAIDTILSAQHPDGGFGGGPHQAPHLLPTYASVCALAVVGRPGPRGGWDQIDRYVLVVTVPLKYIYSKLQGTAIFFLLVS